MTSLKAICIKALAVYLAPSACPSQAGHLLSSLASTLPADLILHLLQILIDTGSLNNPSFWVLWHQALELPPSRRSRLCFKTPCPLLQGYILAAALAGPDPQYSLAETVTPQPATSHKESPQRATSHEVSPQPGASHKVTPQPATSHKVTPQPATSHKVSPQPAASNEELPQPAISHKQSSQRATSNLESPQTSPQLAIQPARASDADCEVPAAQLHASTPVGAALQVLSLSGVASESNLMVHRLPLRRINLARCWQLVDVTPLAACTSLTSVDVSGCWQLRPTGISQLLCSCTGLQELVLSGVRSVSNNTLSCMWRCMSNRGVAQGPATAKLPPSSSSASETRLAAWPPSLTCLDVRDTAVTGLALPLMALACPYLSQLHIGGGSGGEGGSTSMASLESFAQSILGPWVVSFVHLKALLTEVDQMVSVAFVGAATREVETEVEMQEKALMEALVDGEEVKEQLKALLEVEVELELEVQVEDMSRPAMEVKVKMVEDI
eukprot:gene18415-24889_t